MAGGNKNWMNRAQHLDIFPMLKWAICPPEITTRKLTSKLFFQNKPKSLWSLGSALKKQNKPKILRFHFKNKDCTKNKANSNPNRPPRGHPQWSEGPHCAKQTQIENRTSKACPKPAEWIVNPSGLVIPDKDYIINKKGDIDTMELNQDNKTTLQSGLYQTNFRGLTLRECWRFGGVLGFPIALFIKLIGHKLNYVWLPTWESEKQCSFDQLSPHAQKILEPEIKDAENLGYYDGVFRKMIKSYDPSFYDGGSYLVLHRDRKRVLWIAYISTRSKEDTLPTSKITVQASFFIDEMNTVNIMNHNNYMDWNRQNHKLTRIIYMPRADTDSINRRIEYELQNNRHPVLSFAGINHFLNTANAYDDNLWLERLQRGLIEKVPPDQESKIVNTADIMRDFLKDINITNNETGSSN